MTGDRALWVVYGLMALVLVGGGLATRRLERGSALRMALIWLLIFGVSVFLVARLGLSL